MQPVDAIFEVKVHQNVCVQPGFAWTPLGAYTIPPDP